jgi:hypothetical protein
MYQAELASGKNSPQYLVAERLRDEIVAKMQRITGVLDSAGSDPKPAIIRVATVVVRSKRIIKGRASNLRREADS